MHLAVSGALAAVDPVHTLKILSVYAFIAFIFVSVLQ
jgi:hypothetical protein